jgi:hypothetical protein
MPCKISSRTDPRPCWQLLDLFKETGKWRKGGCYLPLNGEVSERIHKRISFQQWQDRFEVLQIVSPAPFKGNWHIDALEIPGDHVICRTL